MQGQKAGNQEQPLNNVLQSPRKIAEDYITECVKKFNIIDYLKKSPNNKIFKYLSSYESCVGYIPRCGVPLYGQDVFIYNPKDNVVEKNVQEEFLIPVFSKEFLQEINDQDILNGLSQDYLNKIFEETIEQINSHNLESTIGLIAQFSKKYNCSNGTKAFQLAAEIFKEKNLNPACFLCNFNEEVWSDICIDNSQAVVCETGTPVFYCHNLYNSLIIVSNQDSRKPCWGLYQNPHTIIVDSKKDYTGIVGYQDAGIAYVNRDYAITINW